MAEAVQARMRSEMNEARRAKDKLRTTVLTTVLSDIRNKEIELGREATDDEVVAVVAKAIKQRREAAEQMRDAGRSELADREEKEAELLEAFTPDPMTEAEVRTQVQEIVAAGARDIGAVMGQLMPRIRGRFDGGDAARIVREELD